MKKTTIHFAGYEIEVPSGNIQRETVDLTKSEDHGCDPLGDGRFRMVPSGDIVDQEERNRRLGA
jgi:hypothetical protein